MQRVLHFSIVVLILLAASRGRAQTSDLAVSFVSPTNGQTVVGPLILQAKATESSNRVLTVEYFAGGQSIGVAFGSILYPPAPVLTPFTQPRPALSIIRIVFWPSQPFSLYWNPTPGDYVLTAKATDDQGNTAVSDPISVRIIPTPVVTVEATEPFASTSRPGIFTISRSGDTSTDLRVPYYVGGTAVYGVDYSGLTNFPLTIPAGQSSTDVEINPLVFVPGKTKAVTLTLGYGFISNFDPSPSLTVGSILGPINPPFLVGTPGSATVYIKANERNQHKPSVRLVQPKSNHPNYPLGSSISMTADTLDRDTYVTKVEFFDGTTKLGESLGTSSILPGQHAQFNFSWSDATVGVHLLRARATDSQNTTQISAPVRIQVFSAP
jgi:hypothetical protein